MCYGQYGWGGVGWSPGGGPDGAPGGGSDGPVNSGINMRAGIL